MRAKNRQLEDMIDNHYRKNNQDHDMLRSIIDFKTDVQAFDRLRTELIEFKITSETEFELKR